MKKFDTNSALAVADTLNEPRLPGSTGARRAEGSLASLFRSHGLTVVERYVGGIEGADFLIVSLLLLGLATSLALSALAAFPSAPRGIAVGAPLTVFLLAFIGPPVWEHWRGTAAKVPILIASTPRGPDPSARLVIVAGLLTPRGRVFGAVQAIAAVVALAVGFVSLLTSRPAVVWALIVVQWAALGLVLLVGPNRWTSRPVRGDNRTGLGMLVELARTWPRPLSDRVETLFVVTPDYRVLPQCLEPLLRVGKPGLALILDAPGSGPDLDIIGTGWARDLVGQAAGDLWLPHRVVSREVRRLGLKKLRRAGIGAVALCGRRDDSPIHPTTIAGAAQLVAEVALRWARRAEADQEESRARSSQNPG